MSLQDDLIIEQIQIGPMQNFAYLVGCKRTREIAVVDPAWDIDGLLDFINEKDYKLTAALVTHYHPDHCGGSYGGNNVIGVAELLERSKCSKGSVFSSSKSDGATELPRKVNETRLG